MKTRKARSPNKTKGPKRAKPLLGKATLGVMNVVCRQVESATYARFARGLVDELVEHLKPEWVVNDKLTEEGMFVAQEALHSALDSLFDSAAAGEDGGCFAEQLATLFLMRRSEAPPLAAGPDSQTTVPTSGGDESAPEPLPDNVVPLTSTPPPSGEVPPRTKRSTKRARQKASHPELPEDTASHPESPQ